MDEGSVTLDGKVAQRLVGEWQDFQKFVPQIEVELFRWWRDRQRTARSNDAVVLTFLQLLQNGVLQDEEQTKEADRRVRVFEEKVASPQAAVSRRGETCKAQRLLADIKKSNDKAAALLLGSVPSSPSTDADFHGHDTFETEREDAVQTQSQTQTQAQTQAQSQRQTQVEDGGVLPKSVDEEDAIGTFGGAKIIKLVTRDSETGASDEELLLIEQLGWQSIDGWRVETAAVTRAHDELEGEKRRDGEGKGNAERVGEKAESGEILIRADNRQVYSASECFELIAFCTNFRPLNIPSGSIQGLVQVCVGALQMHILHFPQNPALLLPLLRQSTALSSQALSSQGSDSALGNDLCRAYVHSWIGRIAAIADRNVEDVIVAYVEWATPEPQQEWRYQNVTTTASVALSESTDLHMPLSSTRTFRWTQGQVYVQHAPANAGPTMDHQEGREDQEEQSKDHTETLVHRGISELETSPEEMAGSYFLRVLFD